MIRTLHPSPSSGAMLMKEWHCRPGSLRTFISSFRIDLTIKFHLCEFFKVDTPAVPNVIGPVDGLLFSLSNEGSRYMYLAPLSATPKYFSHFPFLMVGVAELSKAVV